MKVALGFLSKITVAVAIFLTLAPAVKAIEYEAEIEDFTFLPGRLHIFVGDMVTWRNRDDVQHTSTSDSGVWNSGLLSRDDRYSFTFLNAGVYPYHCSPHPFMVDTVFVTTLSGVEESQNPSEFTLAQNFPNPFNGRTIISYSLPQAVAVRLEIYDMLGRKIETIAEGKQEAGSHEITWDSGNRVSGVFFYRLYADNQVKIGRMTLVK